MERRGVYNKGSQGHIRNSHNAHIGTHAHVAYTATRFLKKLRLPFVAVFAVMFVFGVAPVVGQLEASILTNGQSTLAQPVESQLTLNDLSNTAASLCKGELSHVVEDLKRTEESLQLFEKSHSADFVGTSLMGRADNLHVSLSALAAFVESCKMR